MSTIELRKSIHEIIDQIDNENTLRFFYELISRKSSEKEGQLWNSLSVHQQEGLMLSYEDSEDPENLLPHDDVKKRHEKWL